VKQSTHTVSRRKVLKGAAISGLAAASTPALFRPAIAVPETVKIGLVGPRTGFLALFYEEMSWAIEHAKKSTGNSITINGTKHPLEIVAKDSQSNPNRASSVTQELILSDKVHIVTAFATPETVNPVSDQCEINGMPCVSNDDPLESYFFGRKGDPKKGFEWTYNFFFNGASAIGVNLKTWARVKTNKKLGVMWANDDDGRVFEHVMPPVINGAGFTIIDPGRFDLPVSDCTPEITKFKSEGAEIVFTVIPGPNFTVFWNQCAQQGFKPKVVTAGKVSEFPQGMYPFGDRAINMVTEVWWSRFHPYSSSLTKQSSAELADAYEKDTNQQASMGLGFRHSLLEVPIAALKMTQKLDDPASIRDAVRDNAFQTIVGPIDFKKGPFPNTALTQLVAGQWRKSEDKRWPLELVIVDNQLAPNIPVGGEPEAMPSS
jgi:branched-chain amino acid transport system substrate-binding protein